MKDILKKFNWKMYFALLFMAFCPTIYLTLRTNFLGTLPGDYAFSIAGQLTWVNLLYEIINESIILPLYYFLSKKEDLKNRVKSGLIVTFLVYGILSILLCLFTEPLLSFMATSKDIIKESASYIRIECIANIFVVLYSFLCVVIITLNKEKFVYILTIVKLLLTIICDRYFVSTLPNSLNLGVNGIGYSNIVSNIILLYICVYYLHKEGFFTKEKISFGWCKSLWKVGMVSGLESFVRNLAYIVMISRMVNVISEQGTYWVANNFIWGFLLLPILQLGEIIKQESAKEKSNIKVYFAVTTIVCSLWFITIPFYKPFMKHILNFQDVDKLFHLVMILIVFYVFFAYQNVFDMIFYGYGKTTFMLAESVITNIIYYGACYILYKANIWNPTLNGIAWMFGIGTLFDSIVSYIAFCKFKKRFWVKQ